MGAIKGTLQHPDTGPDIGIVDQAAALKALSDPAPRCICFGKTVAVFRLGRELINLPGGLLTKSAIPRQRTKSASQQIDAMCRYCCKSLFGVANENS